MRKSHAIEQLGGTVTAAAKACEISPSAVSQWPDELTKDQIDRVQAALWRIGQRSRRDQAAEPGTPTSQEAAHG